MNAHARRENIALIRAFRRSVFADRERVGEVHRVADREHLAVAATGQIIGTFETEKRAVGALLDDAARRRA